MANHRKRSDKAVVRKFCVCQACRQEKSRHFVIREYHFLRLGRSLSRWTKRSPDQVSSTAQTLLSTKPASRPISRIRSSVRSVSTPEAFLGHAIHNPPAGERSPTRP